VLLSAPDRDPIPDCHFDLVIDLAGHSGQLDIVPPAWSITYRFGIAMVAMIAYAVATGASLRLTWRQHGLAIVYGIAQYALNYYAVYLAERSVTSGLIAVVFALLIVPNALLAWVFLSQGISRSFLLGSGLSRCWVWRCCLRTRSCIR